MTHATKHSDNTGASKESTEATHTSTQTMGSAHSNSETEAWEIPSGYHALSRFMSYYKSNLLFVRLIAFIGIVFVSAIVVLKFQEANQPLVPKKQSQRLDPKQFNGRFTQHILGKPKTPEKRKKQAKRAAKRKRDAAKRPGILALLNRKPSSSLPPPQKKRDRGIRRSVRRKPIDMKRMERRILSELARRRRILGHLNKGGDRHGSILSAKGLRGTDSNAIGGWVGKHAGNADGAFGLGGRGFGAGGGGAGGSYGYGGRRRVYGRGGMNLRGRGTRNNRRTRLRRQIPQKLKSAQVWQRTYKNTVLSKVSVGGKKYLVLKQLRVTVHIDGLRARTVLDHIYYNPHGRTLQGTFKYTVPPEASVSYYAMFVGQQRRRPRFFASNKLTPQMLAQMNPRKLTPMVPERDWGTLREAKLVPAEKGRKVYEDITRVRIDPALLEQDAPNTFTGRVFPIPSKGYNRILFAYEHTLPQLGQHHVYRMSFPNDVAQTIDFSLHYNKEHHTLERSNLRKLRCKSNKSLATQRCMWEQNKPDRDAVFYLRPKHSQAAWNTGIDPTSGTAYMFARMQAPAWNSKTSYSAQHALFALDTSLSANPDLFAVHVRLLEQILKRNESSLKFFNVMLFDIGQRWLSPQGWLPNTEATRARLLRTVRRLLLEGATYGAGAIQALATPPAAQEASHVDMFVLSDGQWNWSQTSVNAAMASFQKKATWKQTRWFAYRTGLGSEDINTLRQLTNQRGAVFSCLGRSELTRCATAHTKPAMLLKSVTIEGIGASEILVAGQEAHLYPGAMVSIAAKFRKDGKATVTFSGVYNGQPHTFSRSFNVKKEGELAPRAWAEQAIQQLMTLNNPKHTPLIVAYAQHFQIPNKHCSFLVLETDKEYKQYGLDDQKMTHRVNDLALFIRKRQEKAPKIRSSKQQWSALLLRLLKKNKKQRSSSGRHIQALLRQMPNSAFPQPQSLKVGKLWLRHQVPRSYRRGRKAKNDYSAFSREARRRLQKDVAGAVRCITSIVELNQGHPEALRLVGYYLLSWKQPSLASHVFAKVLERRSYEPHSFRDLARSLSKQGHLTLASILYEMILQRSWDRRFGNIHTVVNEEYAQLMLTLRSSRTPYKLKQRILRRKAMLGLRLRRSKLRVTVTWNTDNTDIDLWVYEPHGQRCSYKRKSTSNGGELLEDLTGGYGPERYENRGSVEGRYRLMLHYFSHSRNTLGNETHVNVQIVLNEGTPQRKVIEKSIILRKPGAKVAVATLRL